MSALPIPWPARAHTAADGQPGLTREQAVERELAALREENAHLRRQLAQRLGGGATPPGQSLPESLDWSLVATDAGAPAQLHYEALLGALARVFPIGVFRVDHAGLLTHVDEALQRIFGLNAEAFAHMGWLHRVHPQDRERVERAWHEHVTGSERVDIEFRLSRPDGGLAHLLVRNEPHLDPDGRLLGHMGFVQDISSLRALQADARIHEELNRQIIASSPDCTKVLDLQGHVLQMTVQGCRLVEVDDFEVVRGTDWTQWWKEDAVALARQALADARSGKSARFVAQGDTFKGHPKWWDTVIVPIRDERDQPVMLLAVSRDITEQQAQQDHIRQLNSALEGRVQERTEALAEANDRLRLALDDAQDLYNQAPCGYHSVDAQGTFVRINQTELDWLGHTHGELVGHKHFHDFVQAGHVPLVVERLRRLVAGEKLDAAEVPMRRRDGSEFVALLSSTAVTDEHGAFLRTNSTLVDITARKAAESALGLR